MAFTFASRPHSGAADWSDFELLSEKERHDIESLIHLDDPLAPRLSAYLALVGFCQQEGAFVVRNIELDNLSEILETHHALESAGEAITTAIDAAEKAIMRQLDTQMRAEVGAFVEQRAQAIMRRPRSRARAVVPTQR